ncbi:MAG: hypothetical protein RMY16_31940 [Nostoc sp. DedQUE12b]|uniref:hypothetical protein n=1 Tax=Nostoc sp. DedQUE12b TaxID=3075398 RepID=UPI002AD29319|nr:hypothetical protein [Nostoc sp. DedQUE12b]MDZ8090132.1 hypothetical protein [Nostoc sp. DedQUE12b]
MFTKPNAEDLVFLKELIEVGKIPVVIYCTYPLVELAIAHGYRESGYGAARCRHRSCKLIGFDYSSFQVNSCNILLTHLNLRI